MTTKQKKSLQFKFKLSLYLAIISGVSFVFNLLSILLFPLFLLVFEDVMLLVIISGFICMPCVICSYEYGDKIEKYKEKILKWRDYNKASLSINQLELGNFMKAKNISSDIKDFHLRNYIFKCCDELSLEKNSCDLMNNDLKNFSETSSLTYNLIKQSSRCTTLTISRKFVETYNPNI